MRATVTWPGLTSGFIQFSYTASRGISPGLATIVIPADQSVAGLAKIGDLVMHDGVNPQIRLRNCRLKHIDTMGDSSEYLSLHFEDRRYSWRWGSVDGWYNQREQYPELMTVPNRAPNVQQFALNIDAPNGQIQLNKAELIIPQSGPYIGFTERTPIQMLAQCLAALGERNGVIQNVPPQARPEANWLGVPAAQAMQAVAEQVGATISYQPIRDRVLVAVPNGTAALRDDWPIISNQVSFQSQITPRYLECVSGPVVLSDWWQLEPVGYEEDGRLRHIKDLSYQPRNGWERYVPGYTHWQQCVAGDSSSVNVSKALAKQYVWKTWRVRGRALDQFVWNRLPIVKDKNGKLVREKEFRVLTNQFGTVKQFVRFKKVGEITGFSIKTKFTKLVHPRQIELMDRIYMPGTKDITGAVKSKPSQLFGIVYNARGDKLNRGKNFEDLTPLDTQFTVDSSRGLVTTSDPLYYVNPGPDGVGPTEPGNAGSALHVKWRVTEPLLYLRASAKIRDIETGQYIVARWRKDLGSGHDAPEVIVKSDLVPTLHTQRHYGADKGLLDFIVREDNLPDLERQANYHLAALATKYRSQPSCTRVYAGLVPVEPDTAISQVTWSIDSSGKPTTTVSIGLEHSTWLPPLLERRRNEMNMAFLTEDWVNNMLGIGWKQRNQEFK